MSLPAVNWRYVGNAAFGSATVAAVLDALYTLGTAVVYADGSARTPGTGSAGTYSRYQNAGTTEAVYLTPATTTALNARIILAGYAVAPAPVPTMATPDVAATNTLLISMNKNSGAFASYNAALPFTAGQFFGYWRVWTTAVGIGSVDLYECTEGIWVVVRNTTGAATYHCAAGALLDPESTAALDAESDGRLYGVWTTGSGGVADNNFIFPNASASRVPWNHDGAANNVHAATFVPGAGTLATHTPMTTPQNFTAGAPSTTYLRTRSGRYGRLMSPSVMTVSSPNVVGSMRGVGIFTNAIHGQRQVDGVTTIGYMVGPQSTATQQCYILVY